MGARWPLVLGLVVALAGGAVLAGPAMTSHSNPCNLVSDAVIGSDTNGNGTTTPYRTAGKLVSQLASGQTGCLRGYPENAQPSNAGLYEETVTILNPNLTLRSYPHEVAQLKGRLTIVGADVTVSHLVLDGRNASGFQGPRISHLADRARLIDNDITTRNTTSCVWADGATTDLLQNVAIAHNRIHDCQTAVILEHTDHAVVSDNLIYDNSGPGVRLWPNADYATVQRNVIDRSVHGVAYGSDSDLNLVTANVISNPKNNTLGFQGAPGGYNVASYNCFWKNGSDGIDYTWVSTGWEFEKVIVTANVTANPGYSGAASETDYAVPSSSGCYSTTGSMSAAVTDGERPGRQQAVNLRPNVLFIVTDDQRADTMAMGVMPNTLKWFRDGTNDAGYSGIRGGTEYLQGYATDPLCCPSRASIFSGRFNHNNNVWGNTEGHKLDSKTMLPWHLKQSGLGYYNAMFGKYFNGWSCSGSPPGAGLRHDDDVADGPPDAPPGTPPNFDEYSLFELQYLDFWAIESPNGSCVHKPTEQTSSYVFSRATDFLTQREGANDYQPWFLYLAPNAPHERGWTDTWPGNPTPQEERWGPNAWHQMTDGTATPGGTPYSDVNPPQTYDPVPEPDRTDKPPMNPEDRILFEETINGTRYPGLMQQQLRTLMFLDDKLGPFMQKLEDTGEADDTLAFFISDNGYQWREHATPAGDQLGDCIEPDSAPSPTPAPRTNPGCGPSGKARPYTESVKIPFFMRWPDNPVVQADHEDDATLVANIDLTATAMDAIDRAPAVDKPIDGRSLLASWTRPWMLIEWDGRQPPVAGGQPWNALVNATTSFIRRDPSSALPNGWLELYNMAQDPHQHDNQYGSGGQHDSGETDPITYDQILNPYKACKGFGPATPEPDCP